MWLVHTDYLLYFPLGLAVELTYRCFRLDNKTLTDQYLLRYCVPGLDKQIILCFYLSFYTVFKYCTTITITFSKILNIGKDGERTSSQMNQ